MASLYKFNGNMLEINNYPEKYAENVVHFKFSILCLNESRDTHSLKCSLKNLYHAKNAAVSKLLIPK